MVQARAEDGAYRLYDLLGAADGGDFAAAGVFGGVLVGGALGVVGGVGAELFLERDDLDLFPPLAVSGPSVCLRRGVDIAVEADILFLLLCFGGELADDVGYRG